jgi:hypothetical protein
MNVVLNPRDSMRFKEIKLLPEVTSYSQNGEVIVTMSDSGMIRDGNKKHTQKQKLSKGVQFNFHKLGCPLGIREQKINEKLFYLYYSQTKHDRKIARTDGSMMERLSLCSCTLTHHFTEGKLKSSWIIFNPFANPFHITCSDNSPRKLHYIVNILVHKDTMTFIFNTIGYPVHGTIGRHTILFSDALSNSRAMAGS